MRKTILGASLALLLSVLSFNVATSSIPGLAISPIAQAQTRTINPPRYKRVKANIETLAVRSDPKAYQIGTLFGGSDPRIKRTDSFEVQAVRGYYAYGYAFGNVRRCGWVELAKLDRRNLSPRAPRCPKPIYHKPGPGTFKHLCNEFAIAKNRSSNNGSPAQVINPTTLWGNFRRSGHHSVPEDDLLGRQINAGEGVAWRWITKELDASGERYVLVKYHPPGGRVRWGFVKRKDIEFHSSTIDHCR